MLTNHQLLHFDVETLSTVSTLCKGKHAKIERKLKSSLAMLKHLQERAVKQEHLERDEPAGSKPGSMQAEPVGVNAENTQKMQMTMLKRNRSRTAFSLRMASTCWEGFSNCLI